MHAPRPGRVEVIVGPMSAGKSEELVRRLTRAAIARRSVAAFKPSIDDRWSSTEVVSRAGVRFPALAVRDLADLEDRVFPEGRPPDLDVVGIDEAQFFGPDLVPIVERLAGEGVRVVIAGLDLDAEGRPFGPLPTLLAVADQIDKLSAICVVCGEPAFRSFHRGPKLSQVEIGADLYEARCRVCWNLGRQENRASERAPGDWTPPEP